MTFHIEPVTDLVALAIDWQRLAIQHLKNDQRESGKDSSYWSDW